MKKTIRCSKCGCTIHECGGWFDRVNEKGVKGVWECRPACGVVIPPDGRVLLAVMDDDA